MSLLSEYEEQQTNFNRSLNWSEISKRDLTYYKPTGYVMHQQFNIQQLYALPTLYLCVL